jgi:hypothetical protein
MPSIKLAVLHLDLRPPGIEFAQSAMKFIVKRSGSFPEFQWQQSFSNPLKLPVAGGRVCLWGWFCQMLLPSGGLVRPILPALFAVAAQWESSVALFLQFEP